LIVKVLSPAKINLHLRVAPPASDGFHPLLSWMCTVGLHDEIEFRNSSTPGVKLTCNLPNIPLDETNLIARAAKILAPHRGADAILQKKIPMGGGLGGGSSNAASTLRALNELWRLRKSTPDLAQIAANLGSDIVFFLHGPSSICQGRGQIVTPIPPPKPKFVILILPHLSMPTPAVYKKFDDLKLGSNDNVKNHPDWNHWTTLPATELLPQLINDLEPPAFALRPDLADLRAKIESQISRPVRMSGSGSSLFTLADDSSEAQSLADSIRKTGLRADPFQLAPHSN
jgi:4-diphosphocytidyl-2-C-methyl-D-erythritol kinase